MAARFSRQSWVGVHTVCCLRQNNALRPSFAFGTCCERLSIPMKRELLCNTRDLTPPLRTRSQPQQSLRVSFIHTSNDYIRPMHLLVC